MLAKLEVGSKEDTGKYSFVNRTIELWNQLPAYVLAIFLCKVHCFRKAVRNVILSKCTGD